jgi:cbb3-type cytochrome oxidase subunit 3
MINDNKVDDYTTLFLVTAFFSIAILTVAFYMFKRGKKRAISTNNKLN